MKIFIIGRNGWIGKQFANILENNNINYTYSNLRAEDENILKEILDYKTTHIYCCSGRTHGIINNIKCNTIDYLENSSTLKENINDNLYVPLSLALFADKNNIHFTYIGTGCIFNDDKYKFTENDTPNFFGSNYSIVKGFTDMLIKNTNALILRIRMPISSDNNERNFITKITKYNKICSIPNSMTVLDDMLPICLKMMINNEKGCYNFTNPGAISHNDILELYTDIVDNNFKWENFSIYEQNKILKSKRSNNHLDTSKLESKYEVKHITMALYYSLTKMRRNNEELSFINDKESGEVLEKEFLSIEEQTRGKTGDTSTTGNTGQRGASGFTGESSLCVGKGDMGNTEDTGARGVRELHCPTGSARPLGIPSTHPLPQEKGDKGEPGIPGTPGPLDISNIPRHKRKEHRNHFWGYLPFIKIQDVTAPDTGGSRDVWVHTWANNALLYCTWNNWGNKNDPNHEWAKPAIFLKTGNSFKRLGQHPSPDHGWDFAQTRDNGSAKFWIHWVPTGTEGTVVGLWWDD